MRDDAADQVVGGVRSFAIVPLQRPLSSRGFRGNCPLLLEKRAESALRFPARRRPCRLAAETRRAHWVGAPAWPARGYRFVSSDRASLQALSSSVISPRAASPGCDWLGMAIGRNYSAGRPPKSYRWMIVSVPTLRLLKQKALIQRHALGGQEMNGPQKRRFPIKRAILAMLAASLTFGPSRAYAFPNGPCIHNSSSEYHNRPFASQVVLAAAACSCKVNRLARG